MTRLMYDSVEAGAIPASARMVMLYTDGRWRNIDQAGRFPHAVIVRICAVQWKPGDNVIDCETGDFSPAQAAAAVAYAVSRGYAAPLVYFSKDRFGEVLAAFKAAGVSRYLEVFAADWTGSPHILAGTYGTQYDHPPHSGGHYDLSLMADHIPGIDPTPPAPTPAPAPAPDPNPPAPVPAPEPAPANPPVPVPIPAPVDPLPPADPVLPIAELPVPPEPPIIAEAGISTSEWKVLVGGAVQLLATGTVTIVADLGGHISNQTALLIGGFEFAAIFLAGSYIVSRGIRKIGAL